MSTRPSDARYPQVCMDEMSKQLISEKRVPLPMQPGHPACDGAEDERQGTRFLQGTERRTKQDWARFIRDLVDVYSPTAEKLVLVMDTLNVRPVQPKLTQMRGWLARL